MLDLRVGVLADGDEAIEEGAIGVERTGGVDPDLAVIVVAEPHADLARGRRLRPLRHQIDDAAGTVLARDDRRGPAQHRDLIEAVRFLAHHAVPSR